MIFFNVHTHLHAMSLLVIELTVQRIQVGFKMVEHDFLHHLDKTVAIAMVL